MGYVQQRNIAQLASDATKIADLDDFLADVVILGKKVA